jgi:hypothetical protein
MKEIFYEESATVQNEKSESTKYYIFKSLSVASYVLMVLWIMFIFIAPILTGNTIFDIIFIVVPIILFLTSGILFGKFKNRFYIDYDYTFVTGSIRVAKVIKNIKRKFILKFESSSIEKIGKYGSNTFEKYSSMPGVTKHVFTSNYTADTGKDFYYIVANVDGDKKLMVFECTELFIVNILKFSNKSVLEEEFSSK